MTSRNFSIVSVDGQTKYNHDGHLFDQYSGRKDGTKYLRCLDCQITAVIRDDTFSLSRPHSCHQVEDQGSSDEHADVQSHDGSDDGSRDGTHDDSVDGVDMEADDPEMNDNLRLKRDQLMKIKKADTCTRKTMLKIRKLLNCISECVLNILKENVPLKKEQFDMLRQHRHGIRKLASKLASDKQKEMIVQNGGGLLDDIITPSLCHLSVIIDEHQKDAFDKDTEDSSNASDPTCSSWSRCDSDDRDTEDSTCSSWSCYDPVVSDTDVSDDDDAKSTESEETSDESEEIGDSEEFDVVEDDDDDDDEGNEAESIYSHKPVLIGPGVAYY
jgi:hypothetical protein